MVRLKNHYRKEEIIKKVFCGFEYDSEECEVILSTDDPEICSFKGLNFDYMYLAMTKDLEFFVVGKRPLGCNQIVPLTDDQANDLIDLAEASQRVQMAPVEPVDFSTLDLETFLKCYNKIAN